MAPSITNVETDKKSGRTQFLLKGATPAYANALRRTILSDVPTMAVHEVEIVKNGSALYDEMLAHRLGLIPLKTDLKGYTVTDSCTCEGAGCAKCTVHLTLKAKGPVVVKAGDLESKDPKIVPVHDDMPIVTLLKGQELELVCTARLGRGKDHVKWGSGLVWYTYETGITIKNDAAKLEACKDQLPPQIFDKSGKIDKNLITGSLIDAVEGVCPEVISVERNSENFLFTVEPWGQLSAKEIVVSALDRMEERLNEFASEFAEA
jgi:DNA-directed RNA polymerase subunit D